MLNFFSLSAVLVACGLATAVPSAASAQASDVITTRSLAIFSPRARADLVDALVRNREALDAGEINNARRVVHFMAQIATESGGLTRIDENLNYSADRLVAVFPSRVSRAEAQNLARRPVAIANHVYGDRLGNRGKNTNDGWMYRGSGFIQLTGRSNFRARGNEIGIDLVNNPELARLPKEGFDAAVAYWRARCNSIADRNVLVEVRRCVNGGTNGIDEARIWYGRALRAFGDTLVARGLESADVVAEGYVEELEGAKGILERLGYYERSELESSDDESFLSALEEFRVDSGLPPTSQLDEAWDLESAVMEGLPEDLLYALTDPQNLVESRESSQ